LWHQCYNRELASAATPAQQAIFDAGQEVGRLATGLFPGGVFIEEDHFHHEEAVQSTLAAVNNPDVPAIFEAAFIHDDVRIRVDILERRQNGGWNLIEVKSGTSMRDIYHSDVGVQYRVLKGSDLSIGRAGILHICLRRQPASAGQSLYFLRFNRRRYRPKGGTFRQGG